MARSKGSTMRRTTVNCRTRSYGVVVSPRRTLCSIFASAASYAQTATSATSRRRATTRRLIRASIGSSTTFTRTSISGGSQRAFASLATTSLAGPLNTWTSTGTIRRRRQASYRSRSTCVTRTASSPRHLGSPVHGARQQLLNNTAHARADSQPNGHAARTHMP